MAAVEPHTTQAPSTVLQGTLPSISSGSTYNPTPVLSSPPSNESATIAGNSAVECVGHVFAEYIIHTFGSARYPYPSSRSAWQKTLPAYIQSVLVSSALPISVACSAMCLLRRYKNAVPYSVAYNDDAARLFLSAYVVAAKVGSDPPPSVRWWWRVGEGRFDCAEIVRMEVELCRTLRWNVQVNTVAFMRFQNMVRSSCLREADDQDRLATGVTLRSEVDVMTGDEAIVGGIWEGGCEHLNYYLNPPPPAYQDALLDPRVVEVSHQQHRIPPYSATNSIQRRTHEDDEDYMRLARMFVTPPPPSPARMGSLRRSLTRAQRSTPVEVRAMGAGGKSFMAVVKEKVLQIIRGPPLRGLG